MFTSGLKCTFSQALIQDSVVQDQDQDKDADRQDKDSDAHNQDQGKSQGQIKHDSNSMT